MRYANVLRLCLILSDPKGDARDRFGDPAADATCDADSPAEKLKSDAYCDSSDCSIAL